MRHRKAYRKLGRTSSHSRAMFSNMLTSLVEHRRVKTTERKARELRRVAERAVTRFTTLGDLLLKDITKLSKEERAKVIHAMRMARRTLKSRQAVLTMYNDIAPRYLGRPGGYTRMNKLGFRKGDGAPVALVEFIAAEMPEREGAAASTEEKKGLLKRFSRK